MASLILSAAGSFLGGPVGALIGATAGSIIDQTLFGGGGSSEGPRLGDLTVQSSAYGQPIARVFGAENRLGGNLIWSTGLVETNSRDTPSPPGINPGPAVFTYHVDCAIALCRGPIASVKRIWADGKLFRDADGIQKHAKAIRVYTGTEAQLPDALLQAALGASKCPAHRGLAYVVFERLQLADFGNRLPNFTFEVEAQAEATVATVISELCEAAEVPYLDAARADYLDLRGYTLARTSTVRGSLDPLRAAFFFDCAEVEGELQFFPADSTPVARVPRDDLGAHQFGTDRPADYQFQRIADVEIPRQVTVQHVDPVRDYQVNSQRARRSTVNSAADLSIDLPIVLGASTAKSIAERMLSMAWTRRDRFVHQLPIDYLHVEPGHKIVVPQADGRERIVRVTRRELRLPGSLVIECENDATTAISKTATAAPAFVPTQAVNLPGVTVAHLLDLPILRDSDDAAGFYVVGDGASDGWAGAALYRSRDGGLNYDPILTITAGATIGATVAALGVAAPHYWDDANAVTVDLVSAGDTLSSATADQVLNGANVAVIGDEVVQFRTATLVAPGRYTLSGLLRGRKGTEDKIAGHSAGDRFVLITSATLFRSTSEASEINVVRPYKASSIGTELIDAAPFDFTHSGRWAKPYAPEHIRGTRNTGGDLALSWTRRTRFEAPWTDGVDAPLGEASEAYQVDILTGGGAVLRTLSASTPAVTYLAADQVTDFGAAQASVRVRIYQISARVGRGLPGESLL